MPRTRMNKEKRAQLQQRIKDREAASAAQDLKWKSLDDKIRKLACQPGNLVLLREHIERSRNPKPSAPSQTKVKIDSVLRLREDLIERWGPYRWEDMVVSRPTPDKTNGKDPAEKHVAFEDSDGGSSHTLGHEDLMSEVDPPPLTSVSKPTHQLPTCGFRLHQMAYERAEADAKRAAEIKAEREERAWRKGHPVFGTPGIIKDINSRPSLYSSATSLRVACEQPAKLQAEEERQRERTFMVLRAVLQMYPGETEAGHGARLDLMIVYLRKLERAHEERLEAIIADRLAREAARPQDHRPLTDSEVLSVQQMWRAIHRPQCQLDAPMRIAVQDFLRQFPDGRKLPPVQLAHDRRMLPAIVKAIRTANDAELENDKRELTASRTASLERIWKPTGAALLIRVAPKSGAKQAEPTTPVRKTRSGALPPTPAAPKKAAPKKPTPTKAAPKKSSPAKPTGIKKTAAPTTRRRSARISGEDR